MYSIICEARKGHDLGISHIALVDRSKTKDTWWTSDNSHLIMCFKKRSAAEFSLRKIKRNNPKIVSFDEAKDIIDEQRDIIDMDEAMAMSEQGWDGHK